MFFFHQHPRKINWVEFPIIVSPYVGPLISAFICYKVKWQWSFWVCTILWGIGLIVILFLDEPLYDRSIQESEQVLKRAHWQRVIGLEQLKSRKQRSFTQSCGRLFWAICRLPVFLIIVFYFLNFAWVISVNTSISILLVNAYNFNPLNLGCFYFFGPIGVAIGWLIGHWLHDLCGCT
jgi:MFS family permease